MSPQLHLCFLERPLVGWQTIARTPGRLSGNVLRCARRYTMGKKGKKAQAGKPKKLTPKDIGKRLDALVKKLEEELKGADLFVPPAPMDDCPICLVRLSRFANNSFFQGCCGKSICSACFHENKNFINKQNKRNAGKKDKKQIAHTCPLCRHPEPADREEYLHQLAEAKFSLSLPGDRKCLAALALGNFYMRAGKKDELKGLDYWIKATELGSPEACANLGISFRKGVGLTKDMNRSALFDKVAAIRGDLHARHNIGTAEFTVFGNLELGIRHWRISAEAGNQQSLESLKIVYNADGKKPWKEVITKEDMDKIGRACHEAQEMVKSEEREKYFREDDEMKC